MRITGKRSLALYLLGALFLAGIIFFGVSYVLDGGSWAMRPYNQHLAGGGEPSYAGTITDRNGTILAYSKDGERLYHDDSDTRRSLLHAIGDTNGYISTGVQYTYRSELAGYNLITGLYTPTGKSNGCNVSLTLDSTVNRVALEALDGKRGAVIVCNYQTGEVLCMVSSPTFDPENVPEDIETNDAYRGVYLNNVLSSSYTPGSIFKLVTAAAAIENLDDIHTREFSCSGSAQVGGVTVTCTQAHGTLNFQDALAQSCNIAFAELAVELGKDTMTNMANSMGFNKSFSLDDIPTAKSQYDVSDAATGDLAWSGVGQYTDISNPYHMVLLMNAIANGGTPITPYLIDEITATFGIPTQKGSTATGEAMLKTETADQLKNMMRYNVTSNYGDGMFPSGMEICAKTGTAEVGNGKLPNGWIVGFSNNPATPYSFAVVVEEGNYSLSSAGAVASSVLQALASAG